ncbi:MAG: bifunctional diaminohydroxyphosphoribosylaminopyrimidine deaminase/5-amino-6-(5-phosphoribosylamino)uracil reductase RibD, partial [Acidimicrobiales bacterium]
LLGEYGEVFDGATERPGSRHAERVALDEAGALARGGTLFTTLEPCDHQGRTRPCTDAIIEAGVSRVVVAIADPDPKVQGVGLARLREAGIDVEVGVESEAVTEQLAPYITHRTTGRPRVVLKMATTLDGRIAAPDATSQWITGPESRADVHRLRAESDAIVVGAGTVRADSPSLTVRDFTPPVSDDALPHLDPWRIVLGAAPDDLADRYESWTGELDALLEDLGGRGMVQVLVEGGGAVAGSFHRAGLIDEYHLYMAPAILGGDDGRPLFAGSGSPTMADVQRGRFVSVTRLGDDVRLVYAPAQRDFRP